MIFHDADVEWLGHSALKIKISGKIIYIDPYQVGNSEKADIILITHSHYDHCSQMDIDKIAKDGTIIMCTADCSSKIARITKKIKLEPVEPGMEIAVDNLKIKTVEAYNLSKKFHPKNEYWVGYIIQADSTTIYHAGDTDSIKEMEKLTGYSKKGNFFIAFFPVGGTYTMNAQEAADAASIIKPSLAIPMHYGSVVGSRADAERFVKLCKEKGIDAQVMEKR